MEQMAGDNDPAELTLRWLETWEQDQHVNGGTIPARTEIRQQVIDPWLQASGGDALDLSKAPFKLLAIVNRIDLREHDRRRVATAGEGRFVFGLLDSEGQPLPPIAGTQPGGFLVIFEYEMLADNMDLLHGWMSVSSYPNIGSAVDHFPALSCSTIFTTRTNAALPSTRSFHPSTTSRGARPESSTTMPAMLLP